MSSRALLLLVALVFLSACSLGASDRVPAAELPDPAIYALTLSELPVVGAAWEQSYNQTTEAEGYRWAYLAYQTYQPGSLGGQLETAFAVNNDVVLYEVSMARESLPPPPNSLGNISGVTWKSAPQTHNLGDKSAIWKTAVGDLLTPVWWLEFYQGHAYVRISLLGFPDQIAPDLIYRLGDLVASRLPRSAEILRTDAATIVATPTAVQLQPATPAGTGPTATPSPALVATPSPITGIIPQSYSAPPGGTGMVSFADETGTQLTDGRYGVDDILTDLGCGSACEWVGWNELTEPVTLTFTFTQSAEIAAVVLGMDHRDGLGIFVPERVSINGVPFDLSGNAIPNNQRGDLTFAGPFDGPVVSVVLYHRGRGWILVDEVKFLPGE